MLIGGGVTTAVLLSKDNNTNSAAGTSNSAQPAPGSQASPPGSRSSSAPKSSSSSGSSSGHGKSTPEALQSATVDAYNSRKAQSFVPLACDSVSQTQIDTLQTDLDKVPPGVVYSVAKAPDIQGTKGTTG